MPRYYFHVFNGRGHTPDDDGVDLEDQAAALHMAMESIRSMIAEEARRGLLDLDGHIDVLDEASSRLNRISFPEAFAMRMPDPSGRP